MSSQSLKYLDYTKRRLRALISDRHIFFNPINYNGTKIHQVSVKDEVSVYNGQEWYVTQDEDLLLSIIEHLLKPDFQKEIDFKEAV